MTIICTACGHEIRLEKSKIPARQFKVKCASCGNLMVVSPDVETTTIPVVPLPDPPPEPPVTTSPVQEPSLSQDHVRSELLQLMQMMFQEKQEPARTARQVNESEQRNTLICLQQSSQIEIASGILRSLEYNVDVASSTTQALEKLDEHSYQIVILQSLLADDQEGGRRIILKLNNLKPHQRRQILVLLVSPQLKTSDGKSAFLNGVNLTIHESSLKDLGKLIEQARRENDTLYGLFHRLAVSSEKFA